MGTAPAVLSTLWYVGLGALVAYVFSVLLFLRRQRRAAAGDEARCGACGYPRRGLPGPICPECGSDVNIVGLRQPTWWNRRSPATRRFLLLVAWTVGIGGAAAVGWTPFHAFVQPGTRSFFDLGSLAPASQAYRLDFMRVWKVWMWPWDKRSSPEVGRAPDRLEVQLGDGYWYPRAEPKPVTDPQWQGRTLFIAFFSDGRYASRIEEPTDPARGTRLEPITEERQGDWIAALQRWTQTVAERYQLPIPPDEVSTALEAALATPYAHASSIVAVMFSRARGFGWDCDGRFTFAFGGVWVLLWLVGLVWLIRTRDRVRAAVARPVVITGLIEGS